MTADMAAAVLAANDSYDLDMDGVAYRLDVDVEPVRADAAHARRPERAFAQTAHACGTHKLVATAQACIDLYAMDVTGRVSLLRATNADGYEEVARDIAVTGSVEGFAAAFATLELQFAGGSVSLARQNSTTFALVTRDLQALLTD